MGEKLILYGFQVILALGITSIWNSNRALVATVTKNTSDIMALKLKTDTYIGYPPEYSSVKREILGDGKDMFASRGEIATELSQFKGRIDSISQDIGGIRESMAVIKDRLERTDSIK